MFITGPYSCEIFMSYQVRMQGTTVCTDCSVDIRSLSHVLPVVSGNTVDNESRVCVVSTRSDGECCENRKPSEVLHAKDVSSRRRTDLAESSSIVALVCYLASSGPNMHPAA